MKSTYSLVLGAGGTLGSAICRELIKNNVNVIKYKSDSANFYEIKKSNLSSLKNIKLDSVIFAQGINFNDSIFSFDEIKFKDIIQSNVILILKIINFLLSKKLLQSKSRVVIISSVWSKVNRENKLSYSISKSAIDSAIRSLAIELGRLNIAVNGIAPGVIDSKMTKQNLTVKQIEKFLKETPTGRLVKKEEIAKLVYFLSSMQASGINGEIIRADNGWSITRNV